MNADLLRALNEHLQLEFDAYYRYLAMSHWLDLHDLPGFATWLRNQSAEEALHAQKFIDHLLEREETPVLPAIAAPGTQWSSVLEIVTQVYESEKKVTAAIGHLYDLAEKAGDRPAQIFLQWFVTEQVEEENTVSALLGRLRLAGDSGVGLLMVDQELAKGQVAGAAGAGDTASA
ncbi:MAG: ferritin [Planctomycetes bacterium]|nr:ferritin [Planctomycetota bacterium]